jgi:hypothetical protein
LLLGLIHGHFDETEELTDDEADDGLQKTKVNMGLAVVIPIERVSEVLVRFNEEEEKLGRERLKKKSPAMDLVGMEIPSRTPGEDGITKSTPTRRQHLDDLGQASRNKN